MIYYNQRDYKNVVYSYTVPPKKEQTIASAGCGPACCAMIVGNLSGDTGVTPIQMAAFALEHGFRVSGGTNMIKMAPVFAQKYGYLYSRTGDIKEVLSHLQDGGMAIANVAGGSRGLFSSIGHYIMLWKMDGERLLVLDPYLYKGKFDKPWRKEKVILHGNIAWVLPQDLDKDVRHDYEAYYLFKK